MSKPNWRTDFDGQEIIVDEAIFSGQSGEGIKYGDESASAFGWADITAPINVRGTGSNDPLWLQIGSGPFYAYAFAVNDECWMPFHIPHDIVPSSSLHFHCHWLPSGTNTANVKWQFDYMFAKGFDQAAYSVSGTSVTAEEAGPGTAYQHMVTESGSVTISALTEPDGILYVRMARVTNGGTDNTDTIFVLTADVHYQTTGINSTPNKAPGFYNT